MNSNSDTKAINAAIGRLNALHAFCAILARSIPIATAQTVAADLAATTAQLDANAIAQPIPDSHNDAMLTVLRELQTELQRART